MEELAAEFDHRMLETFFTKVKIIDYINDQDQAVINKITHQSNASLSLGGFGLSSAYDKLSTSFISSLASAVRTDTTLNAFDHYSATSTPISGSALSDRVNTALQSFHGIVKQHKLPKTTGEYFTTFEKRRPINGNGSISGNAFKQLNSYYLQQNLTSAMKKVQKQMIKEALDTPEKFNIKQKAGYLASMVPESSDWLKATPSSSSSSTFIPNTAFEYACRYR